MHRHKHLLAPAWLDYVANVSWADHAVSLESAAYLQWLCDTKRPDRVLDTGSGFSSYVLRLYARDSGAEVVSVDDDDTWMEKTAGFLDRMGVGHAGLMSWSSFRADPSQKTFDVVFHDMGTLETRVVTAADVARRVSEQGAVIFDDVHYPAVWATARNVTEAAGRTFASLRIVTADAIGRYAAISLPPVQ